MPPISPYAGLAPEASDLIDISQLIRAYEAEKPSVEVAAERVAFGTSGHRGCSLERSFNRDHILTITQAICEYRKSHDISGPLFMGLDTHALSLPAFETALEVFVANGVSVMISPDGEYTPTPVISHAILTYNRGLTSGLADGIVISPSHNPPRDGGFKYNPPHGGPADSAVTKAIQDRANELLRKGADSVARVPLARAKSSPLVVRHDYLRRYVEDLASVIDFDVIRSSSLRFGVDPLGGAGVHYWPAIAETYRINLTVLNLEVDPTFRFLTRDWDGEIRMDPSSAYAMKGLIARSRDFDLSFACDTDHDRHGIVTPDQGLMPANHYLAVSADYLLGARKSWRPDLSLGKTVVTTQMMDRVAKARGRQIYEVPVGFKWFVEGLHAGRLGYAGEESAGASFLRRDGGVWTTDKDGLIPGLLAAEMTARLGKNPAALYADLTQKLGAPVNRRIEAPALAPQREKLGALKAADFSVKMLAGEAVEKIETRAPGNDAAIGGVKVQTANGWFAARPSGTEEIYKIYAESFRGEKHLEELLASAQELVDRVIA